MHDYTREIAGAQPPYCRTAEFSEVVKNTTRLYNTAVCAGKDDETIILTCSGTGAMEATVINCLSRETKVLVINGGAFGQRWVELCKMHKVPCDVLEVPFESDLTKEMLEPYRKKGYFALLVNIHETSIGKLYDAKMLSEFCARENMYFFVDAISSLFADEYKISKLKSDITIVSSQKALALNCGLAVVTISQRFYQEVIAKNEYKNMYFDFADCVKNAKRGQTPFTPAISVIFQLQKRLEKILEQGMENLIKETRGFAEYFRARVTKLPVKICSFNLSNSMTPLMLEKSAKQFISDLFAKHAMSVNAHQDKYDKMVRIGSMGALQNSHYDKLLIAMEAELKIL